mgnify:FL=1
MKIKFLFLISLFFCNSLFSHELNPARLYLEETTTDSFRVLWKYPTNSFQKGGVIFPESCVELDKDLRKLEGKYLVDKYFIECHAGLKGKNIKIKGLSRMIDALISIDYLDGSSHEGLASINNSDVFIPIEENRYPTSYFTLGIEHLLSGIDHILFVVGLIFLVSGWLTLIKTITAFTLAHSITLGLSVYGIVNLPQSASEAIIALTLIYMALEILEGKGYERTPWLIAFGFGLIHGLGFAGALSEIGFSNESILLSLLFFNLGIEAGQLLLIPFIVIFLWLLRKTVIDKKIFKLFSYILGGIGSFWLIQRLLVIIF